MNHRIKHALTVASAGALVTASAGFGAFYAWTTGSHHGPYLAALSVLMALGLEGATPFAIEGAFTALRSWSLGRALALALLGSVATAYSLTAELSLMAAQRADNAAQRSHDAMRAANAKARYEAAQHELEALPITRPTGTIAAEITRLKSSPKIASCQDASSPEFGPVSRRICSEIASLTAEAATTSRRAELQLALREAERDLTITPAPTNADPAASALATFLSAAGVLSDPGTLSEWLALVPVLALEIGSALAVVLANGSPSGRACSERLQGAPRGHSGVPERRNLHEPKTPPSGSYGAPEAGLRSALLEHLRERGGCIRGGQRGLAKALGTSTTELHRTIHALAAAGVIALSASSYGTELRLVA